MDSKVIPSFIISLKKDIKIFDLLSNNIENNIQTFNPICSCPICYNKVYYAYKPNNCSHLFCKRCISSWRKVKKQCPLCRKSFSYIVAYN